MKPAQSLILLAANRDFRLIRAKGSDLTEIAQRKATEFADLTGTDEVGQGRSHSHGISFGNADPGAREAEDRRRLARHAVQALEAEWTRARPDRLVLVAGPKMLGDLRAALPAALAAQVTAEIAKDLVQVALHDLPAHLDNS